MKRITVCRNAIWPFLLAWLSLSAGGRAAEFETVAETTGYRLTATYDETVDYFQRIADTSEWAQLTEIGTSPQGRPMHLLIVSRDGAFTPEAARRTGKLIVLIQNGIHAGEIDGKDACMALVREMAVTRTEADLLDNVILLVIPIFNLDGHENRARYTRPNQDGPENAGFRATAQFYNLNRDYLKADTPEMRAWIANWVRWLPDFFIDNHVTDGRDWPYTVSYTMPWHPNSASPIRDWTKTYYDPYVNRAVRESGFKIFPYAFFFGSDPTSGVTTFVDIPRFSTGYTALWNRPGLLIEMHSLKDYQTRVLGNYAMLKATLEILNRRHTELQDAIAAADEATLAGLTEPYPLTFQRDGDSVMMDVEIFEFDTVFSAASGSTYYRYDRNRTRTYEVPYYGSFQARHSIIPPRAYLIPREWHDQIERLRLHGIRLDTLTASLTAPVEMYHLDSVKFAESSYEGHVRPSFTATLRETTVTYPVGTVVVDLHQRAAKVAIQALEPEGPDSFIAWGLWNTILERKEYIESYVIDPLADEMLANNPELRKDFLARLQRDNEFAGDPQQRRMFFYERSRYAETTLQWYPVGRLLGDLPAVNHWEAR